jgi:ribosomal protein L21E
MRMRDIKIGQKVKIVLPKSWLTGLPRFNGRVGKVVGTRSYPSIIGAIVHVPGRGKIFLNPRQISR